MKNYLKSIKLTKLVLVISLFLSLPAVGILTAVKAEAKQPPLSLADILTGLRSKKTSLAQRNKLLANAVKTRGITFTLTAEIEKELKGTGANKELLDAVRQKNPKPNPQPTPQNAQSYGVMNSFDVDYNVFVGGRKGMLISPKFTVYNLRNTTAQFIILFETSDGKRLPAVTEKYASTTGNLIVGDFLTPNSDKQVFNNLSYFLPYDEIDLPAGNYDLRMGIYLTHKDGTPITKFDYYYFTFRRG